MGRGPASIGQGPSCMGSWPSAKDDGQLLNLMLAKTFFCLNCSPSVGKRPSRVSPSELGGGHGHGGHHQENGLWIKDKDKEDGLWKKDRDKEDGLWIKDKDKEDGLWKRRRKN